MSAPTTIQQYTRSTKHRPSNNFESNTKLSKYVGFPTRTIIHKQLIMAIKKDAYEQEDATP